MTEGLKEAYRSEQRLHDLVDDLNAWGCQKATNTSERFLSGLMSYTALPKQHGQRIRTINIIERVNNGARYLILERSLFDGVLAVGSQPHSESPNCPPT